MFDEILCVIVPLVLGLGSLLVWRYGDRWRADQMSPEDWERHNRDRM